MTDASRFWLFLSAWPFGGRGCHRRAGSPFLTSIVGVVAYAILCLRASGSIALDWIVGAAIGVGGLLGAFSARAFSRGPEYLLRRGLGQLAFGPVVRYAILGLE